MSSPQGWSADHSAYPYDRYDLQVQYKWSSGRVASPISYVQGGTSTEQTAASVSVAKPQGRKILTFDMVRQTVPPQIPDPYAVSGNEELLEIEVFLSEPKVTADGTNYYYVARGVYTYLLKAPIVTANFQYPLGKVESGQRQGVGGLATGGFEG